MVDMLAKKDIKTGWSTVRQVSSLAPTDSASVGGKIREGLLAERDQDHSVLRVDSMATERQPLTVASSEHRDRQ